MDFVARYVNGDHERVWRDLISAGSAVRSDLEQDAQEVVRLTMLRVRRNLEVLASALSSHGFHFGVYPDGEEVPAYRGPLTSPQPDIDDRIADLESLIGGPIPLAVCGFWRWVGSVCFVGYAERWPDYADPL